MKIINSKTTLMSLILIMMLAFSVLLTGCGSPTLEDYTNENEEFAQQLTSAGTKGMSIDVEDNTLTYAYKYEQKFDEETIKIMNSSLEDAITSMESSYESAKNRLVEETGIEDIVIKIIYTDGNDTVLYEKEY